MNPGDLIDFLTSECSFLTDSYLEKDSYVLTDLGNSWMRIERSFRVLGNQAIQLKVNFGKYKPGMQYVDNFVVLDITDEDGNGIPHYLEDITQAGMGDNPVFSIRVQAKDEYNATVEKAFTVNLTEDPTEDTDADGFTDQQETSAGTDPYDPSSTPGLDFGLIAYYPFDGNASDQSANANHGTLHGPSLAEDRNGESGGALSFDGTDDWIDLGNNTFPELGKPRGQLTITGWFSIEPTGSNQLLITDYYSTSNADSTSAISFGYIHGEKFFASTRKSFVTTDAFHSMPQLDSTWHSFAIVLDSSNDTISLFFNGSLSSQSTFDGSEDLRENPHWYFGSQVWNNGRHNFFKGRLDEFRIYDRALSTQEISTLYSLEAPSNHAPTNLNSIIPLSMAENQPIGTSWRVQCHRSRCQRHPDLLPSRRERIDGQFLFTLDANGTLTTATFFDYESNAPSYSIRVQAKDEFNATVEEAFTVSLTDLNEAPTLLNGQNSLSLSIPEGSGTVTIPATWDRTFGGSGFEELGDSIPTPDGGYLFVGTSDSNATGDKSQASRGQGFLGGQGGYVW